jgi:hypothetical protein
LERHRLDAGGHEPVTVAHRRDDAHDDVVRHSPFMDIWPLAIQSVRDTIARREDE